MVVVVVVPGRGVAAGVEVAGDGELKVELPKELGVTEGLEPNTPATPTPGSPQASSAASPQPVPRGVWVGVGAALPVGGESTPTPACPAGVAGGNTGVTGSEEAEEGVGDGGRGGMHDRDPACTRARALGGVGVGVEVGVEVGVGPAQGAEAGAVSWAGSCRGTPFPGLLLTLLTPTSLD